MRQLLKNLLIAIVLFLSGWLVGSYWNKNNVELKEKHEGQFQLINPLLECEGSENMIIWNLEKFKTRVNELISREVENNKIKYAAVYFRDLNNGPWFGINQDEPFLPGSLLKVPIMMGFLKKAESDPTFLKKQIKYDRKLPVSGQYVRPAETIKFGMTYTIEELIYRMIVYSDNDAAYLLRMNDIENVYGEVYRDLGLPMAADLSPYFISAHKYASFFRILFNASYMNKEMSNVALKILSNADFAGGIRVGVPSGIIVAQKFGESKGQDNTKQLHDCGIIYYPGHPYMLCVMTKGDDYGKLVSAIEDISKLIYEEVDRRIKESD